MNNGKICVSVCAATADELIEQIKRAADSADVVEIRFDCLKESEWQGDRFQTILRAINSIKRKTSLLATFRPREQGGRRELTEHERGNFFRYINAHQIGDFEDVEIDMAFILQYESAQQLTPIHSFHDFSKIPHNTEQIFDELASNADIIKIAAQAGDITDSIPIWTLLGRAKTVNKQIIPVAMGESGKWTRILGLAHGAFMTYASLDAGSETAPGQVSAADLINVYRVKELNETTEVYGILGGNTSVSMSPYIHNAAFKFHDLNSVFVPLQVQNLDEFMRRMVKTETREIELNFRGFSVTIPHKQSIIRHLDQLDETAARIGAVNTVKIVDGRLHGFNTDAHGFIEPLINTYGDLHDARVAVLGAGGAARACVYALQTAGARVTVFARDLAKARSLAEDFRVELKQLTTGGGQPTNYNDFDILVNTTPLGMKGKAEGETPVRAEQLKGLHLVYDLVYVPFQTPLMAEADLAEVPKIGGLAMLIAQAGEQQKIWTGLDAPIKEMSRAALERLQ